jgi:DNA-binding transcriptional LysR family regulator
LHWSKPNRARWQRSRAIAGILRIAISDGIVPHHLAELIANCRRDAPEVYVQLPETSVASQIKGLQQDLYDTTFAQDASNDKGIASVPLWDDALVLALPTRHPLLTPRYVPLNEALQSPVILPDRHDQPGTFRQISTPLNESSTAASIIEASSFGLTWVLVSAGYGVAFVTERQMTALHSPAIAVRPLADHPWRLMTCRLRRDDAFPTRIKRHQQ